MNFRKSLSAICILLLIVSNGSFAQGTAATQTIYGSHWTISSTYSSNTCSKMTDLYLDVTGAISQSPQWLAHGRITCNIPSGTINFAGVGVALMTVGGLALVVNLQDMRIVCTLPLVTLSSNACTLYDLSTGAQVNTFGLTYVP